MKNRYICYLICIFLLYSSTNALLNKKFISLKFSEVNSRVGPGKHYIIAYLYKRKFLPLEVIDQYDNWRKVKDIKGDISWIHISSISRNKAIIVNTPSNKILYSRASTKSLPIGQLEPNTQCIVKKISTEWVKLDCSSIVGWCTKSGLWGI